MARKTDYSVTDVIDTFEIAYAANLWAGYPSAYAPRDKPVVPGEPAEDMTARPITSIPSATEALRGVTLHYNSYDIATAMKAAVKAGRLGKREDPRMEMKRTREEYRAFALDMHERARWGEQ